MSATTLALVIVMSPVGPANKDTVIETGTLDGCSGVRSTTPVTVGFPAYSPMTAGKPATVHCELPFCCAVRAVDAVPTWIYVRLAT